MNKINKKLLLSLLLTILANKTQNIFAAVDVDPMQKLETAMQKLSINDEQTKNTEETIDKKEETKKEELKPLVCAEMELLNSLLVIKPVNVLRMKSSYKTAANILKTIEEENAKITIAYARDKEIKEEGKETKKIDALTSEEVIILRDKLLKPVESFFSNLYDYQSLLKPLVVKILVGDDASNKDRTNDFLFLQFFNAPKKEATTFFKNTLVTEEKLAQACKEFDTLFGVVTRSLSKEVQEKEKELIKKLRSKRPVRKK